MRASEEAAAFPHQLQGLSQEAGMLGSSLLWHEFPTTYPGKKKSGASLSLVLLVVLSDGSRRLLKMGFLLCPLPDPPGGGRNPLGISWACPTGLEQASISGIPAVRWKPPGPPKLHHPLPQGWGSSS